MLRHRAALAVTLAAMAVLAVCLAAVEIAGYELDRVTGDVASTASVHPWTGALSTLGLLGWGACFSVCAITGAALHGRGDPRGGFFVAIAAVFAYMTADDAFLLHEWAVDEQLGLPQPLVYVLLAASIVWIARRYSWVARGTDLRVLGIAIAALSGSVALDVVEGRVSLPWLEEWLKLSGIAALCVWSATTALKVLNEASPAAPRTAAAAAAVPAEPRELELSS